MFERIVYVILSVGLASVSPLLTREMKNLPENQPENQLMAGIIDSLEQTPVTTCEKVVDKSADAKIVKTGKNNSFTEKNVSAPPGFVYVKTVRAKLTGYEPSKVSCENFADGRTAVNRNARRPGAAADPRAIPFGSKVFIPELGWRVIDDTGGAMRQSWKRGTYHIDVRFKTVKQARKWGVKWYNVRVFKPVEK